MIYAPAVKPCCGGRLAPALSTRWPFTARSQPACHAALVAVHRRGRNGRGAGQLARHALTPAITLILTFDFVTAPVTTFGFQSIDRRKRVRPASDAAGRRRG